MGFAPLPTHSPEKAPRALRARLNDCMLRDRARLSTRVGKLDGSTDARVQAQLVADIERSTHAADARRASLPSLSYPEELPICARRDDIAAAIRQHQVVIVCGETGSGKTTQLPKICLELGRGIFGTIGHTQPRRIAARSVASRIAQELRVPLGQQVGFQVRFNDKSGPQSLIKLMTDGILLAETQTDRLLRDYDTLIIDEAHERSLNIDFLLGYVHAMLPRRPDLKVIITSATIDAARFAQHFGSAPVIEVSGRLYPVEVRYRPMDEKGEEDLSDAIVGAVDELFRISSSGDALVFLPGEREIRETAEALRKHHPRGAEILPLFSRLSAAEQERVFAPGGARRIVLATNVAETSLTVPGVRYVVDSGLARLNRYSFRNKVEMLQVEKISRASANQRAGRCGRVASGVCIRLYAEEDFQQRQEFTEPEILRSSLASVILRMKALRLGEVEAFPFVDAPSPKAISDGYQLLGELGAVDARQALTPIGMQLAKLPIDPRMARMIVAARQTGCLREVLIIAAGLSLQDPRERPLDKQEAADRAHEKFSDERSDFSGMLKLWEWFDATLKHKKSNRKLRDECHENFLSQLRLREWRDLYGQLHGMLSEMGWEDNLLRASAPGQESAPSTRESQESQESQKSKVRYEEIHRSLLAGLLGNIGFKSEEAGVYLGARAIKFAISPASVLKKKTPRWIMAAELTETSRLYARGVAIIEPEWIESLAGDLVKRSYLDPHWSDERGAVIASEQVSLYGLIIVPRRKVQYAPINPAEARDIFIQSALVAGTLRSAWSFLADNQRLIHAVMELEHKSRRHDVLVDDETMAQFYDERVAPGICDTRAFEAWRKETEKATPRLLHVSREYLMRHAAEHITADLYPDHIEINGQRFELNYRFEPSHVLDGVTMRVPLALLNQIDEKRCEWLVPGLLRDKITHLIKALPKGLRKHFVPVPQSVTAAMEALGAPESDLFVALSQALHRKIGVAVPVEAWSSAELPPFLRMNFSVLDTEGKEQASGRDLAELRKLLGVAARRVFSENISSGLERKGLTKWDIDELPEQVQFVRAGHTIVGYPALVDEGDSVAVAVIDTEIEARNAMRKGLVRLFQLAAPDQIKLLARSLPGFSALALHYLVWAEDVGKQDKIKLSERLRDELVSGICQRAFFIEAEPVRDKVEFQQRVARARARLTDVANELCREVAEILVVYQLVKAALVEPRNAQWPRALTDIRHHLRDLLPPAFISLTPFEHLRHFSRYLRAVEGRLSKLASNPERDADWMQQIARLQAAWSERTETDRARGIDDPRVAAFHWMLEELRVSLWAQQLKTPYPVSFKRLERYWSELR